MSQEEPLKLEQMKQVEHARCLQPICQESNQDDGPVQGLSWTIQQELFSKGGVGGKGWKKKKEAGHDGSYL